MERWQSNPREFLKDNWPDLILWDKLDEIIDAFYKYQKIVVPAGHGVGKDWLLARLVLAFLYSYYPAKVITTAPTWTQVESILWGEIRKAHDTARYELGGRLLNTDLKIEADWFAIGFSTRGRKAGGEGQFGASKFQGFHSENLLVVLDEAPGIEHEIWVAVQSLVTGKNNRIVAVGNPTSPSGDFFDACKSPLWHKIHISCFDHPNVKTGRIVIPGAVTRDWIEDRRQEWGEDSPLWVAKVKGEFPAEGVDTLIPLAWAEACVGLDLPSKGLKKLGIDVARFGGDETVLMAKFGKVVKMLAAVNKKDTNWTIGRAISFHREFKFDSIGIDDNGVGGGVTDALTEKDLPVDPMIAQSSPIDSEQFENCSAEIAWNLRNEIKEKQISLPNDPVLINQLCSRRYKYNRKGKIVLESKDEMKKRGLKSPDRADALAIANSAGRAERSSGARLTVIGGEDDDE